MPNRRETKKLDTLAAIIDAASGLIDQHGYDETSIESIAAASGVSPGTVYNYFGTKSAILAAILTSQVDEIMPEAAGALDLQAEDPIDALMPVLSVYIDCMTEYGRDLLKEVLRAGFDPAQTALLADLISVDERIIEQLGEVLSRMQSKGLVSATIDTGAAANLVYSIMAIGLIAYASLPDLSRDDATLLVRSQLDLVFEGLGER